MLFYREKFTEKFLEILEQINRCQRIMERVSYFLAVAISSLSEVSAENPGNVIEISADNRGHGHGHLHHPNKVGDIVYRLESDDVQVLIRSNKAIQLQFAILSLRNNDRLWIFVKGKCI